MEKDVVCGMQVDPAKAAGTQRVQREDVLLLLEGLQDQVRRESQPIREVSRLVRRSRHVLAGDRRTGAQACNANAPGCVKGLEATECHAIRTITLLLHPPRCWIPSAG